MQQLQTSERGRELRSLLKLAMPIAGAHLANYAMQVVDTIFVGRLGPEAIGGVAIGNTVFVCFMLLSLGLLLGMDFLISKSFGAGRIEDCHSYLLQGLYVTLLVSIPVMALMFYASDLFVFVGLDPAVLAYAKSYQKALSLSLLPFMVFAAFRQYLQAMNVAGPITVALVLANVVNAFFNWLLVFGNWGFPRMEVAGSATASFISRIFLALFLGAFVLWRSRVLGLGLGRVSRRFSPTKALEIIRLGLPSGFQMVLEVGVFALATLIAGRLGVSALAAHQVVLQVASVAFMVPLGLSAAAAVRVGQRLGSGDKEGAIRVGWLSLKTAAIGMGVMGVLLFVFSGLIMQIFTQDPVVISIGRSLLLIAAFFQLCDGVQVTGSGILRGVGNTKISLFANLVGHWCLGLPVGAVLGLWLGWGISGIWIGLSVGLVSVAGMLTLAWKRKGEAMLA